MVMELSGTSIRKAFGRFQFALDNQEYCLFGIRGALPACVLQNKTEKGYSFSAFHKLRPTEINYIFPSCTIGILNIQSDELAVFPGSTLPSTEYLTRMPQKRAYFNILCPGKYVFSKGLHPRTSKIRQYPALLMNGHALIYKPHLVRVPAGLGFNFENAKHEVILAGDNLHATEYEPGIWNHKTSLTNMPVDSSGCITVCGCPKMYQQYEYSSILWNSWQVFYSILDNDRSRDYSFMLLNFKDLKPSQQSKNEMEMRYGSEGEAVFELQSILSQSWNARSGKPYYDSEIDGRLINHTASSAFEFAQDISSTLIGSTISLKKIKLKTKHFAIIQ